MQDRHHQQRIHGGHAGKLGRRRPRAHHLAELALPLVPNTLCGTRAAGLPAPQPACAPRQRTGGAQPWAQAPELRAQILRLYQTELWRVGTIASQLHLHRDTVQRVLGQACVTRAETPLRPSQVGPYLPFIRETLAKFPTLTASRLHAMVRERGYTGGADHFRHLVACHRPRPTTEAFLRLRTLPGEQAQVDWGLCRSRHRPHYAESPRMPSSCINAAVERGPP